MLNKLLKDIVLVSTCSRQRCCAEGNQRVALLHPADSDATGEASMLAQSLLPFCFPLGQYADSSAPSSDDPHYFVVSDSEGEQKHGFCRPINVVRYMKLSEPTHNVFHVSLHVCVRNYTSLTPDSIRF